MVSAPVDHSLLIRWGQSSLLGAGVVPSLFLSLGWQVFTLNLGLRCLPEVAPVPARTEGEGKGPTENRKLPVKRRGAQTEARFFRFAFPPTLPGFSHLLRFDNLAKSGYRGMYFTQVYISGTLVFMASFTVLLDNNG